MERIRNLTLYQKCILLILLLMALVFAVVYGIVTNRVGYRYHDSVLVPSANNGITVYEGKVEGLSSTITVTKDKTVTFQFGERRYGPYTAKEDPAAIPTDHDLAQHMTGIVIMDRDNILFEGGVLDMEDPVLFSKDDSDSWFVTGYAVMSNGTMIDSHGNPIDPVDLLEPSPRAILELMGNPRLSNKGDWGIWFVGLILSVFAAVSILFADELFIFSLSWRVRYAENTEPSDWEIASRYIAWTLWPILILSLYIMGLQ